MKGKKETLVTLEPNIVDDTIAQRDEQFQLACRTIVMLTRLLGHSHPGPCATVVRAARATQS